MKTKNQAQISEPIIVLAGHQSHLVAALTSDGEVDVRIELERTVSGKLSMSYKPVRSRATT